VELEGRSRGTGSNSLIRAAGRCGLDRMLTISPRHLAGEPLIVLSPQDSARCALDRAFAEAVVTPRVVVETPYSQTVAALVRNGAGIGLVNPYALDGLDCSKIAI
jgi:DNA-binding transcriptional LysR family regulator